MTVGPITPRAIIDEMIASARRKRSSMLGRSVSQGQVLRGIGSKTLEDAKAHGWLNKDIFDFILDQCDPSEQAGFQQRWRTLQEARQTEKIADRRRRAIRQVSIAQALRQDYGNARFWSGLAHSLFLQVATFPWPYRPEEVSQPLDDIVERGRYQSGEQSALKNALILMRAAMVRSETDRPAERLMLLSIIVAALKIAGLLGHRRAQRGLFNVLDDLHRRYPTDTQIERVWLCANGLTIFHASGQSPSTIRRALSFHAGEAALAEQSIKDRGFARDWPVIYREVRGPAWNLMNVRVDAGLPVSLAGRFFQQHVEWQTITEDLLPPGFRLAENHRLAVETEAYDVRFRVRVWLDRSIRNESFASVNADQALFEIDEVLGSAAIKAHLNELTIGHLRGLQAEALLCLYARHPTDASRDEYIVCRDSAIASYVAAGDQANSQMWAERLRALEHSTGLTTSSSREYTADTA